MKKSLLKAIFALVFPLCSLFAFSFGGRPPESIVGYVKYYGNVPFEFPGFETVDGYIYTIKIEENADFSLKDITAAQGYLLELTGEIDKKQKNGLNVLKDGVFTVSEWKKL